MKHMITSTAEKMDVFVGKLSMQIKQYNEGKEIKTWIELYEAYNFFYEKDPQREHNWILRGEHYYGNCSNNLDLSKALRSSLDKAFRRFDIAQERRNEYEQGIVRSFQRKAHLYSGNKSADLLESLALLRHFEGPARMLDGEYSFFVGVYFAVARAEANGNPAVWALNNDWLAKRCEKFEKGKVDQATDSAIKSSIGFKYLMDSGESSSIYAVNPYYLNERLSIQQGVLLVQGNVIKSWAAHLKAMIE